MDDRLKTAAKIIAFLLYGLIAGFSATFTLLLVSIFDDIPLTTALAIQFLAFLGGVSFAAWRVS